MKFDRFRQLALLSTLGLTAACAGPDGASDVTRSAVSPQVLSGVTTPGQAYLRELTIGAAEGMRVAGWYDRDTEARVDIARDTADLFRYDMRPEVRARYDEVRMTGYEQGLSGAWDADALNGYLDVIEAGNARFMAIEGAGHSDYAWGTPLQAIVGVTGASYGPLGPDRHGHAVAATALASEINEASFQMAALIEQSGEDRVPAVEMGDRLRFGWGGPEDALAAYAEVLPVSSDEEPDAPGM
jgi:hypothetical protein